MQTTPTLPEELSVEAGSEQPSLMQAIVHDQYGNAKGKTVINMRQDDRGER